MMHSGSQPGCVQGHKKNRPRCVSTVTLNPAIDIILFIDEFKRDVTARIREKTECLGGKGAHISVNLSLLGEPNQAFGILFGETGRRIESLVSEAGVIPRFVHGEGGPGKDSRTNYVIMEQSGSATIISEHGVDLTDSEIESVLDALRAHTGEGDILVFSGDVSNVKDPYIYSHFIEATRPLNVRAFVDASGPALKRALESAPFLIKPNRDELAEVTGIDIKSEPDALRAIRALERYGIENIALSLGAEGSIVRFGDGQTLRAIPPEVPVRNQAGCGDAFLAGLALGFSRGWEAERMLRLATAVSAATAASPLTVGFDKEYADLLLEQVQITAL